MPLLVLTADRPPELRDLGAGQTIDQVKLYGSAAKWFLEVDAHAATPERLRWLRQLACRAFWTAVDGRPGPGAPELLAARAAGARRAARARHRWPRRRASVGHAAAHRLRARGDPGRRTARRAPGAPASRDRGRPRRARSPARPRARRLRRAGRDPAARRSAVRRAPRSRGRRALRRAAARRRLGARARARSGAPGRRPADLEAAAPVAARLRRRAPDRVRPRGRLAGPGGRRRDDPDRRPADHARSRRRAAQAPPRQRVAGSLAARRPVRRGGDRAGALPCRAERAARRGRAGHRAAGRGHGGRRVVDAGARRGDVLPGARAPAAGARQPRGQRDRRDRLDRLRGRRGRRRSGRAPDRRRRADP